MRSTGLFTSPDIEKLFTMVNLLVPPMACKLIFYAEFGDFFPFSFFLFNTIAAVSARATNSSTLTENKLTARRRKELRDNLMIFNCKLVQTAA